MNNITAALVPYRPANGTEGAEFIAKWCDRCRRDYESVCPIRDLTLFFDIGDPSYPKEWVRQAGDALGSSARCTAFESKEESDG